MNRIARAIAATALAASGLGALPTLAGATTYCVSDPACVGAGGTAQASLNAAMTAANAAADADVIKLGAGTFGVAPVAIATSGKPVEVVGAGRSATRVIGTSDNSVLALQGGAPQSVRDLTLLTTSASPLQINGGTVSDVTIRARNAPSAISVSNGGGTIERVDAESELGIAISSNSTSDLVVRDSRIAGFYSIQHFNTGIVSLQRVDMAGLASIIPSTVGVNEVVDSVVRFRDTGANGFFVGLGDSVGATGNLRLRNVTMVAPADAQQKNVSINPLTAFQVSSGGSNPAVVNVNVDVDGLVLVGPWHRVLRLNATAPDTATFSVRNSDIDLSADRQLNGTGGSVVVGTNVFHAEPGFVDLAGGDLRPRGGSPLIDAGPTAGASATDVLGAERVVNGRADIGAYEYRGNAPTGAITAPATAAGGSTVAVSVAASDADPGEGAALTYAWSLPGGGSATSASATFTAPDAPGSYPVAVNVTDRSGATTTLLAAVVVPRDTTKPVLKLVATGTRASVLKRLPVTATFTSDDRVTASLTLTAVVTAARVSTVVPVASAKLPLAAGPRPVKLVPTAAAVTKLKRLLAQRGAKVTWRIGATATNSSNLVTTSQAVAKIG